MIAMQVRDQNRVEVLEGRTRDRRAMPAKQPETAPQEGVREKPGAVEIYRDGRVPDKDELRGHARRFTDQLAQQSRLRPIELLSR